MTPAVPETKGGVGTSFKGTAAYLLHDVGAKSAERVGWTDTRNLATDDSELAWRLMAATAKDAERLKRNHHERAQAALPETERTPYRASKPTKNAVFHYSLAWHPDEAPELTRDEMMRAANWSLRELKADHLQALIVCHRDKDHAHVHVMVNRIDPETGRAVPIESNAQKHLSRFALAYERERGQILCPQREAHAEMRKAGLSYVADKRVPRLVYENSREAADEAHINPARAAHVREAQYRADTALSRRDRGQLQKHRREWDRLAHEHRRRKALINDQADQAKAAARLQLARSQEPEWRLLLKRQDEERRRQLENERSLIGRLKNTVAALKGLWRGGEPVRQRLGATFGVMASQGARNSVLAEAHAKEKAALAASHRKDVEKATRALEEERKRAIHQNLERYKQSHADMVFRQAGERAATRAAWRQRDTARVEAWRHFKASERLRQEYGRASAPERSSTRAATDGRRSARSAPTRSRTRERQ